MRIQNLLIQVPNGSVGKSLIAYQLAFHRLKNKWKIWFIDDDQSNILITLPIEVFFPRKVKILTDFF